MHLDTEKLYNLKNIFGLLFVSSLFSFLFACLVFLLLLLLLFCFERGQTLCIAQVVSKSWAQATLPAQPSTFQVSMATCDYPVYHCVQLDCFFFFKKKLRQGFSVALESGLELTATCCLCHLTPPHLCFCFVLFCFRKYTNCCVT